MESRYNLNRIAYFVAIMEEGTITAAARRLGLSKAVVSKQLRLLEEEIGVSLLFRNTRRMTPTAAGLTFYERSRGVLEQANDAFDAVRDQGGAPRGRLRIAATIDYGLMYVAPLAARYRQRYPEVVVELALQDEQLDLVEHRYDVKFRIGWLRESSNLARRLEPFHEVAVCTPATLARASVARPADLTDLPFVANSALTAPTSFAFTRGDEVEKVAFREGFSINATAAIRQVVLMSPVFAVLPDFLVADDLRAGRLVPVCPGWSLRSGAVYTVRAPSRATSRALSAFLALVHGDDRVTDNQRS